MINSWRNKTEAIVIHAFRNTIWFRTSLINASELVEWAKMNDIFKGITQF